MNDILIFWVSFTGAAMLILGVYIGYTFTILTEQVMDRRVKRNGNK